MARRRRARRRPGRSEGEPFAPDVAPARDRRSALRRAAVAAAACAGLLVATEVLFRVASLARGPVTIDVGPNTAAYLTGFTESWEYRPVTARWVGPQGAIDVPALVGDGSECVLRLRHARLRSTPAAVHVAVNGQPVPAWTAAPVRLTLTDWVRSGRRGSPFQEFGVQEARVHPSPGPLHIDLALDADSPDALAIDWVRLEGGRWRLGSAALGARIVVVGAFVVAMVSGLPLAAAVAMALTLAVAQAAWAASDPFAAAHAADQVAIPAVSVAILAGLLARRWPAARGVAPLLLAAYLLKGAAVFHPSFYYPDVLTHARYTAAFARAPGGLVERGRQAQVAANVAYPRQIAGRNYAMPYSPVFYVPFAWLPQQRALVEAAMKHVALAAAVLEVLAVFWLASVVAGGRVALGAALVCVFLPPLHSRLLLAMWPTLVGHLLDTLAIASAAWMAIRPEPRRAAACGALTLAAVLTYISSLFNLGGFFVALAALERRTRRAALLVGIGSVLAATLLLYAPFTRTFVSEIAPAWWRGAPAEGPGPMASLAAALQRIPLFFGYAYPILAAAGLYLARRRCASPSFHVLCAYAIALGLLVALRAFTGGVFKDLKEVEFAGPLVSVSTAIALVALAERGRTARGAAVALTGALVVYGLVKYWQYVRAAVSLADLGPL